MSMFHVDLVMLLKIDSVLGYLLWESIDYPRQNRRTLLIQTTHPRLDLCTDSHHA